MAEEYQGAGFDDVRQLVGNGAAVCLDAGGRAHDFFGRGTTANGYSGVMTAPTSVTATTVSASIAPTSSLTPFTGGAVWYIVAADAGDLISANGQLHQGPTTAAASVSAVSSTQALQVTVGGGVTGALGYNLFTASVQSGPYYWAGRSGYNVIYASGQATSGATATASAADASAQSFNYDGIFAGLSSGPIPVTRRPLMLRCLRRVRAVNTSRPWRVCTTT